MASTPPTPLNTSFITWPAGREIHRIHDQQFQPAQFNPGLRGNARFSPITDAAGNLIPTLYGGDTFACAAMETVFHDVSFTPGPKDYQRSKMQAFGYCVLAPMRDLHLVDLCAVALRKLGIARNELIDTEATAYPATRKWATDFHTQHVDIDGLCWISRQDDRARALVLFGDRLKTADLLVLQTPRNLLTNIPTRNRIADLALAIGVNFI